MYLSALRLNQKYKTPKPADYKFHGETISEDESAK